MITITIKNGEIFKQLEQQEPKFQSNERKPEINSENSQTVGSFIAFVQSETGCLSKPEEQNQKYRRKKNKKHRI